jgi:hypothetical protein
VLVSVEVVRVALLVDVVVPVPLLNDVLVVSVEKLVPLRVV